MFCGQAPCECNKKPEKPPRAPKVAKPKATPAPETPAVTAEEVFTPPPSKRRAPSMLAAMKGAAAAVPASHTTAKADATADEEHQINDVYGVNDEGLPGALRALWPIMHAEDRAKFANQIGPEFIHGERKRDWKERMKR